MTDKNLTEIVTIIDRSGSMESLKTETISGFNNFVQEQKKIAGKVNFTLVQFDDQYQIDYSGADINDIKPLDESSYVPRGMTALLDAVGKTIITVGERLAELEEDQRPGQIIFLIITDGHENHSQEYRADKIKEMVKHQTDKYNWTFIFMGGGNIESQVDQGKNIGIADSYGYSCNRIGTQAVYSNICKGVSRRRQAASLGMATMDSFLTEEEREQLINNEK